MSLFSVSVQRIERRGPIWRSCYQQPTAIRLNQGQSLPRRQRYAFQQRQTRLRRSASPEAAHQPVQQARRRRGRRFSLLASRPSYHFFSALHSPPSAKSGDPNAELRVKNFEFTPGQLHIAGRQWQILCVLPLGFNYLSHLQVHEVAHSKIPDRNCDVEFNWQSASRRAQS
jgi:hypothetical protein